MKSKAFNIHQYSDIPAQCDMVEDKRKKKSISEIKKHLTKRKHKD